MKLNTRRLCNVVAILSNFISVLYCDTSSEPDASSNLGNDPSKSEFPVEGERDITYTQVLYVNLGETANLKCDIPLNQSKLNSVEWFSSDKASKTSEKLNSTTSPCPESSKTESDEDASEGEKCIRVYNVQEKERFWTTLKIYNVDEHKYKTYECKDGDKILKRFKIREPLRLARIGSDDKLERSVVVLNENIVALYCNVSGTLPEGSIDEISFLQFEWFKDGENITEDLENSDGLFANFSVGLPNEYSGPVSNEHRGVYECSIRLKDSEVKSNETHEYNFPIKYKFTLRVQEANRWMIPGVVLLVEIIGLGIFTIIIWKVEERKEKAGEVPESEDEDEASNNNK